MGLREETSDGIAGDGSEKDVFSKMGPNSRFWSQKSHLIFEGRNVKVP